jgi:broad-specificity NMP kinase
MKVLENISAIALIIMSGVLLYVAVGAFNRLDQVEAMMRNSESMLANVSEVVDKLERTQKSLPETVKNTGKGLVDGIRDGLNNK